MPRYKPIQDQRLFTATKKYSDFNWNDLQVAVTALETQITEWYINPLKDLGNNGSYAFAAMALNCLLIDALSQYDAGAHKSSGSLFVRFIRRKLPQFALPLPCRIKHWGRGREEELTDTAEVIYSGFRCGILHQAHAPLYCALEGGQPIRVEPQGLATYEDGSPCPTVVLDPWQLSTALQTLIANYVAELRNPAPEFDGLRITFRRKLADSFGV